MTLNRNRPYGTISGTGVPASFTQTDRDGKTARYYNSAGYEVDVKTGQQVEFAPAPVLAETSYVRSGPSRAEIDALLAQKDSLSHLQFAIKSAALLGDDKLPTTKAAIMAALEAKAGELESEPTSVARTPNPATDLNEVDLRAWGTGERTDYLFSDVAKAILTTCARDVGSKADAVDALIDAGIISSSEAISVD